MLIILLLALLGFGAVWGLVGRKRQVFIFNVVTLLLLFAAGGGWIAQPLMARLQVHAPLEQPEWKARNAIVVLGAGTVAWNGIVRSNPFAYSRMHEAARLYFQCANPAAGERRCAILVTGGDPAHKGVSEAEIMRRELVETGVKNADVLLEEQSLNTYENARFSAPILAANGIERVILVTTGAHLPRALLAFSAFQIAALPAPADQFNPSITWLPSAWGLMSTEIALHEMLGILRFHIYENLGLNSRTEPK